MLSKEKSGPTTHAEQKKPSSHKTFSLITTTINVPKLLDAYFSDAKTHEAHLQECIVVGDNKTPADTAEFCKSLTTKHGVDCRYISVEEQKKYLSRWPEFAEFLPWNCIQRRNVGLLLAYENKADIVITIDDDNLIHEPNYFGHHTHLGEVQPLTVVATQSGWWNVCEMLMEDGHVPFYHRGHPLSKRWLKEENKREEKTVKGRAVVNAGLWLGEPDVDGLARLYQPFNNVRTSPSFRPRVGCDVGTWAPFNSQNTALLREVIPAYFLFPYLGRYDDIWASYIVRHISDYFGDYVTYGAPLVRQERNVHDIFKDFDAERFGLEYNDIFLETLRSCSLQASSYQEAFKQISEQFPNKVNSICLAKKKNPDLFSNLNKGLRLWAGLFENWK